MIYRLQFLWLTASIFKYESGKKRIFSKKIFQFWRCTPTFTDEIFSRPISTRFTDKKLQNLHSILRKFRDFLPNLFVRLIKTWSQKYDKFPASFTDHVGRNSNRDRRLTNFLSVKVGWHDYGLEIGEIFYIIFLGIA